MPCCRQAFRFPILSFRFPILIVDRCLPAGKPFAVVPCCVFPNANPHRRLLKASSSFGCSGGGGGGGGGGSGGGRLEVRSLAEFCQYLLEKDHQAGRIKLAVIEAMPPPCNTVVYFYGGGDGGSESVDESGSHPIASHT